MLEKKSDRGKQNAWGDTSIYYEIIKKPNLGLRALVIWQGDQKQLNFSRTKIFMKSKFACVVRYVAVFNYCEY